LSEIPHIKLSDLAREVRETIRINFPDTYWVVAEVSGHKFYPNNDRHYFELIEKEEGSNEPVAKVNARAWYEGSQTIKLFEQATGQIFTTGLQVLIKVKLEFHPAHGFALILVDIDQSFTLGNIEKQRRLVLKKLTDENPDAIILQGEEYITRNKKARLNIVVQHIAIIGSPNSEGYIDFTHTLENNQYGFKFKLDIYQSSVQGMAAEKELVAKLIDIHTSEKKYDCVVMIRGGGAKTDFLVFDTYQLSRATARFPIPIITGLGHHKDVSIVDMMANTSVKTPTKAAEFIIAHNRWFEEEVMKLQQNVIIRSQQLLKENLHEINLLHVNLINDTRSLVEINKESMRDFRHTLTNTTMQLLNDHGKELGNIANDIKTSVKIGISKQSQRLENTKENVQLVSNRLLKSHENKLVQYQLLLKLMDPQNLLKKGFAMVSKNGKITSNAGEIQPGDELTIHMHLYDIQTQVKSKEKNERD